MAGGSGFTRGIIDKLNFRDIQGDEMECEGSVS